MRTQRELQVETEKMKEALFSLNMKLELVRKQNNDLKDKVEVAEARIEELEPLEEENHELQEQNNSLTLKLQNLEQEAVELIDRNVAILKIQDESVANMEKQHAALEEATEIIIRLESEKSALTVETSQLKEELAACQSSRTASSGTYHTAVDANRFPSRVHSIDDSRPSTSHFDSDYYSQPGSPQVKGSKDSLNDIVLSDRARQFINMKNDNDKSTEALKKRLSDASLAKSSRPVLSVPEVPPIPESYQGQPQSHMAPIRTPRRTKPPNNLSPAHIAQAQSGVIVNPGPRTPTAGPDGLRGMYRDKLTLDTSTRGAQASPSYSKSPLAGRSSRASRSSDRPTPPDRHSSKRATVQSSQEQFKNLVIAQLGPESPESVLQNEKEDDAAEWASLPPPPSIISDLTTEPGDHRERWWQDTQKLQHRNGDGGVGGLAQSLAVPSARTTPRGNLGAPYMETDFLFNANESEEDFLERARSYSKKR
jgi:hypothetical protein